MDSIDIMPTGFDRLMYNLLSIFLFCHWCTCLKYFLATFDENYDSWIYDMEYIDTSIGYKYLRCYYWVVMTATTVGYGDVPLKTTNDRLLAIVTMFAGVIFFSFMVGM